MEFLLFEQYPLAARCFGQITREMPGCYEAWANLGYTKLMMYCDKLSPEDLQNYDIGYLVTGGFYREAQSLERGIDEQLWYDAFGALREAVRLKPDAVLPKATMAIAYLVHPKGKDVGGAEQLFQEVLTAINSGNVEASIPRRRPPCWSTPASPKCRPGIRTKARRCSIRPRSCSPTQKPAAAR